MSAPRVAVVGAGWAGLAAAITLLDAGCVPTVFEAAREPGGRARRVDWSGANGEVVPLDNGQHILIGAYASTLALMRRLEIDVSAVLKRRPIALASANGFQLVAPSWPAPWHLAAALLRARGLTLSARWALVRLLAQVRAAHWRVAQDVPLAHWLRANGQPTELIALLWGPLCVAALNTPIEIASTQVFLNVLRDSLGAQAADSDLLLPQRSLDELLPRHAVATLLQAGATVALGRRVRSLALAGRRLMLDAGEYGRAEFDGVVLATPAHQVASLLADPSLVQLAGIAASCEQFAWQPISTIYLQYEVVPALPLPMLALGEDGQRAEWGQWLFDKNQLGGAAGLVAVVISAAGGHQALEQDALIGAVEAQLARQLGFAAHAQRARVITEKRATFACIPGLQRPANETPLPGLVLAGDYTASDYPATLESAVRSGTSAATMLVGALRS